jgi:uncharacterized protein (DUF2252 family)
MTAEVSELLAAEPGLAPFREDPMSTSQTSQASTRSRIPARRASQDGQPGPAERAALGKAARTNVPRTSAGNFQPSAGRADPIDLLELQATSRVPELVPIRYGRMAASPFAFFRGGALIMAHDLATTPTTGFQVQLCGDAHLSNFGVFASPERRLVFDINDFDETHPGPWEWDVKRLAASLAIAGRENGFSPKQRRKIVLATVRRYREAMREFAEQSHLTVWYANIDLARIEALASRQLDESRRRRLAKFSEKVMTRDSVQAFTKMTHVVDGQRRIVGDPPLVVPISELLPDAERADLIAVVSRLLRGYRRSLQSERRVLIEQYRFVDMARKVVGVGSVGTRAWIVLMAGRDETDPLFLQVKEAQASVLEQFVGRGDHANQGHRVVAGQRLMQASSDIFLGWHRATGIDGRERDFYVRQLRDWKGSAVIEEMPADVMEQYGQLCGWTLARAHARAGSRIAIAAYLGAGDAFDQAIQEFSETYADLNERDYNALLRAIEEGRLTAQRGL